MSRPAEAKRNISIVIPVHNEEESAPRLHEELSRMAASAPQLQCEFIFVDDGSKDRSWDVLESLHKRDPRVRAVRLKRNFGQTPAMACGIEQARGEFVVTMDGDLQNDPADIPRMIEKLDEGYDLVCGWRHQRQDKLITRKIPSMVANRLIGLLTGVQLHDYGCSLKAYRAEAIKRTPLYAELHRFIPAMSQLTGALVAEMKVNHRARKFGKTKYNLSRTWRVALDMITVSLIIKFAHKPLRFFGMMAIVPTLIGILSIERSWRWYFHQHTQIPQVLPSIALASFWLAVHLWTVGLIAELCIATAHHRSQDLIAPRRG